MPVLFITGKEEEKAAELQKKLQLKKEIEEKEDKLKELRHKGKPISSCNLHNMLIEEVGHVA